MGTRHLIAVMVDGQYKVAQYGQWDGYPEGQGVDCLRFLQGKQNQENLKHWSATTSFLSDDEIQKVNADPNWKKRYPQYSRDTGAKILFMVADDRYLNLIDSLSFAGDSLFCEWAYVIDFDKGTFEVFRGFQTEPIPESERFYGFPAPNNQKGKYWPVKLVKAYSLDDLPTEGEFLADFGSEKED